MGGLENPSHQWKDSTGQRLNEGCTPPTFASACLSVTIWDASPTTVNWTLSTSRGMLMFNDTTGVKLPPLPPTQSCHPPLPPHGRTETEMSLGGISITGWNDNLQCSQWWKFRQNDDIFISAWVVCTPATAVGDKGVSEALGPRFQTLWLQLMKQFANNCHLVPNCQCN